MKKSLFFLIALLLSLSTFGQSDYSRGFQNGYKVGYCYNDYGCIPPIPLITPIPRIGESQDNYQDGYNRGFKQGLEDKQAKKSSSSGRTEIQVNYSAPFLGESSHDPIEFARRRAQERKLASQNAAMEVQNQQSENFAEGMERYSLQMEGWEDQKGYEELREKISAIQNIFIKIHLSGMNIISPQTSDELKVYEAMNEAMDNIRSKYYVWQSQKIAYRAAEKIIYEQIIKKESERTIDIDATRANMRTLLDTPGILNRSKITGNLIVYKPISEEIKVNSSFSNVIDVDGNVYKTILIGTQTWMAENLKATKYNNGTSIPLVTDTTSWSNLSTPAYCWYNNDPTYKGIIGALYNWYTVKSGKLCPTGWHVPSDAEWTILTDYLGGESIAGGKLKSITGWGGPNTGATNETSFATLPGGERLSSPDALFYGLGDIGCWWTTASIDNWGTNRLMYSNSSRVQKFFEPNKCGLSVRCVMD